MKFKKKNAYSADLPASALQGHFDAEQLILVQITKHFEQLYLLVSRLVTKHLNLFLACMCLLRKGSFPAPVA